MSAFCTSSLFAMSLLAISSACFADVNVATNLCSVVIDLPLDEISVEPADKTTARFAGGVLAGSPGEPALPRYIARLLLPPNADLRTVKAELKNVVVEVHPGTWEVLPYPATIIDGRESWPYGSIVHNGKDVAAYGKSGYWPKIGVERRVCKQMRQWKLVQVTVAPVAYAPKAGKLKRITEAQLLVRFSLSEGTKISRPATPNQLDAHIRSHLQRATSNFDDLIDRYDIADPVRPTAERRRNP